MLSRAANDVTTSPTYAGSLSDTRTLGVPHRQITLSKHVWAIDSAVLLGSIANSQYLLNWSTNRMTYLLPLVEGGNVNMSVKTLSHGCCGTSYVPTGAFGLAAPLVNGQTLQDRTWFLALLSMLGKK